MPLRLPSDASVLVMRAPRRTRYAAALLGALTAACSDATSVSERMLEAYRGPLTFLVAEDFASPAPGLPVVKLRVRSVAITSVAGRLEGDYAVDGRTITVRARQLIDPGCDLPCISLGVQPSIDVPLPRGEGEYTLRFDVAGSIVDYRLRVESDLLSVEAVDPSALGELATKVITPELAAIGRIPERLLHLSCGGGEMGRCAALESQLMTELGIERVRYPEGRSLNGQPTYLRYRTEPDFPRIVDAACSAVRSQSAYMVVNVGSWLGVFRQASRTGNGVVSCQPA